MMDNNNNNNNKVRFGDITIREYPMVLGEHPSCSSGAPVQLAWQHQSVTERNLELYEYMRIGERRRGRKALSIPVEKRGMLLLQAGFSLAEIGSAALEVEITKKFRSETLKNQKWDRANIILETTKSLPRGVVNGLGSLVIKPKQRSVHARSA